MKFQIRHLQSEIAFTLVELLVVVAIIVVLLALLVPAMDKAVYQAELAVCGTRVRGIAEGATIYAVANSRKYPFRERYRNGNHKTNRPNRLWLANGSNPPFDEREYIRPYVGSINKQFQCPFLTEMNLDLPDVKTRQAGETGWASYQFWYGWQYSDAVPTTYTGGQLNTGERGMFKIGDRFTYTTTTYTAYVGRKYSFDILANDYDLATFPEGPTPFNNTSIGSHPDRDGVMGININTGGTNIHLWSRWQGPYKRGLIDMNFAHADNSVSRLNDVVLEQTDINHLPDERMVRVPEGDADEWPTWRNMLPPVN